MGFNAKSVPIRFLFLSSTDLWVPRGGDDLEADVAEGVEDHDAGGLDPDAVAGVLGGLLPSIHLAAILKLALLEWVWRLLLFFFRIGQWTGLILDSGKPLNYSVQGWHHILVGYTPINRRQICTQPPLRVCLHTIALLLYVFITSQHSHKSVYHTV